MTETAVTLKQLFELDANGLPGHAKSAFEASAGAPALKEKLIKEAGSIQWGPVCEALAEKVADLLDIKLVDVLLLAWKKYKLLMKYTDRDRYSPEETILVPLAEHTVKSEHHPYVEILVGEKPIGKIVFDVTLLLTLSGFALTIQDAKIKAIQTGSCQGKGTLAFEGAVLVEKAFDPISLPGTIHLSQSVNLRGLAAAG